MIGNHAIGDRRQAAGADDTGIEQCEGLAGIVSWRQLRDGTVQHRRCAVEDSAEHGQEDEHRQQRHQQRRKDDQTGCRFGGDHGPDNAEPMAKPAAGCLAERTTGEKQRQSHAHGCLGSALGVQQKRQKQQISHAGRGIESPDGEEQAEAFAAALPCHDLLLGWHGVRLFRNKP